jgi:hypothetical protein
VTETVPLYVCADKPAVLMPSVSVPAPEPDAGETASHGLFELADQDSVPPPAFETLTVCVAGALLPSVKENVALFVEIDRDGTGAPTVSLTEIVCGLAPVAVTLIAPLYVCALNPAALMPIVSVPAPVPEVGVTVSHELFELADHENVPPPALAIVTDCVAGVAPPAV